MRDKTPAERHADETREQEIGGTAGKTHTDVLTQTLGREEGLAAATGIDGRHRPVVVGEGDAPASEPAQEAADENEEINDKKLERHGNVGDAARRDADGRDVEPGERTA